MESMPPTRRARISDAEQTSASHVKGPAVIMMIDRSAPLAWKKSPRRETLFDFAIRSSGDAYGFACSAAEIIWNPDVVLNYPSLAGTSEKPRRVPKNLSRVHLGFGVTLTSHDASKDPRRCSMRPDRVQIEPALVTAGKSFSGSNTLLKKFVREYMATSATISMMFASV